jgi:hypothetical protein
MLGSTIRITQTAIAQNQSQGQSTGNALLNFFLKLNNNQTTTQAASQAASNGTGTKNMTITVNVQKGSGNPIKLHQNDFPLFRNYAFLGIIGARIVNCNGTGKNKNFWSFRNILLAKIELIYLMEVLQHLLPSHLLLLDQLFLMRPLRIEVLQ